MVVVACSVGALLIGYGIGYINGFRTAYKEYRTITQAINGKHIRRGRV